MTLSATMLDADLAEISADLPQTITLLGTSYAVDVSDESIEPSLDRIEGYSPSSDVTLTVRVSVLPLASMPKGTVFTYNGRSYRVDATSPSQDGVSYEARCVAEDE